MQQPHCSIRVVATVPAESLSIHTAPIRATCSGDESKGFITVALFGNKQNSSASSGGKRNGDQSGAKKQKRPSERAREDATRDMRREGVVGQARCKHPAGKVTRFFSSTWSGTMQLYNDTCACGHVLNTGWAEPPGRTLPQQPY